MGKLATSRRYDLLPLLRSSPGGFAGSWPCRTYPFCGCKGTHFFETCNRLGDFFSGRHHSVIPSEVEGSQDGDGLSGMFLMRIVRSLGFARDDRMIGNIYFTYPLFSLKYVIKHKISAPAYCRFQKKPYLCNAIGKLHWILKRKVFS